MKYFTIDAENNITAHANRQAARDTGAGVFSTEVQLADLIGPNNQRLIEIWNSLPGVKPVTKFANRKVATERIWKAIQSLGGPVAAAPEKQSAAEIAAVKPVAQPPRPEPAPESAVATSEPSVPAAEQQPDSEPAPSQAHEPSVAPVEAAHHTTPFDEPVANVGAQAANVAPTTPTATKKTTRTKKAPTGENKPKVAREGSKTDQAIAMMKRPGGATLTQLMAAFGWQAHTVRGFMAGAMKKAGYAVESFKSEKGERTYRINP